MKWQNSSLFLEVLNFQSNINVSYQREMSITDKTKIDKLNEIIRMNWISACGNCWPLSSHFSFSILASSLSHIKVNFKGNLRTSSQVRYSNHNNYIIYKSWVIVLWFSFNNVAVECIHPHFKWNYNGKIILFVAILFHFANEPHRFSYQFGANPADHTWFIHTISG